MAQPFRGDVGELWATTSNFTNSTDEPSVDELNLATRIVYCMLLIIVFFMSTFGNSVVCLIVFKRPAMRSAINLLLATLALCHICLTSVCLPLSIIILLSDWLPNDVPCRLSGALYMLFVTHSSFILMAISIDRYLIIIWRRDKLTPYRAKLLIAACCLLAIGVVLPPCFGWGLYVSYEGWPQCILHAARHAADRVYIVLVYTIVFYVPMLVMGFCYARIIHQVRLNLRRISNYPVVLQSACATKLGLCFANQPLPNIDMSFKTRAFKTILILYGVFVICWLPLSMCLAAWTLDGSVASHYIAGGAVIIVGYFNTAINPIIYFWRIRKFKEACAQLMPRLVKWLPGFSVRTRRRVNPSRVYEIGGELASVGQSAV